MNFGEEFKFWPEGTKSAYSMSLIKIKQVKDAIPGCVLC